MSLKRTIFGQVFITDFQVANEVIKRHSSIRIESNHFSIQALDEFINNSSYAELKEIENEYRQKLSEKQRRLEEERKRIELERKKLEEERKRLEEEKRIARNQKEILRQLAELEGKQHQNEEKEESIQKEIVKQRDEEEKIKEQKQKYCQDRLERITANALKKGYVVKKKVVENNKIKLILQRKEF